MEAPRRTSTTPPLFDVGIEKAVRNDGDDDGCGVGFGSGHVEAEERDAREREEDDMEALVEAVERESGAEGKPVQEARRICCRFLLDAFRDGQFGTVTLDSVPRRKQVMPENSSEQGGWEQGLVVAGRGEGQSEGRKAGGRGRDSGETASGGDAAAEASSENSRDRPGSSPDSELADRLVRDWSSADAWERPETRRT